ncbi:MAG: hypothetical protein ACXVB9_10520 [Bdellovibrionota bacterium]
MRSIATAARVVSLSLWTMLVIFEILSKLIKRYSAQLSTLALTSFTLAVAGEVVQFQYEQRKDALYESNEAQMKNEYEGQLKKAHTDAQRSELAAQKAGQVADIAAITASKARELLRDAGGQLREAKEQTAPRSLSPSQTSKLQSDLNDSRKFSISMIVEGGDPESFSFASKLFELFKQSNWNIENGGSLTQLGGPPPQGVIFEFKSEDSAKALEPFLKKLQTYGLDPSIRKPWPRPVGMPDTEIQIHIGQKKRN